MTEVTDKCTCGDKVKVDVEKNCPVCQKKFIGQDDLECPLPSHKIVFCCGVPLETCPDCLKNDLHYISGHGGMPHIFDNKLNKTFYKLSKYETDDIPHLQNGYTHMCERPLHPTTLETILSRKELQ